MIQHWGARVGAVDDRAFPRIMEAGGEMCGPRPHPHAALFRAAR